MLDLVGIFVFAISGALVGVRKDLDIFGVLVLAGATGLGGGFIRDLLIGATPPAALNDWRYLSSLPVPARDLLVPPHAGPDGADGQRLRRLRVSLFCVAGALKALDHGLGLLPAALMGMATGIGGGILRDLLAGRVPVVFRGELYATPALAGAVVAARRQPRRPTDLAGHIRGRVGLPRLAVVGHLAALAGADADRTRQRLTATRRTDSPAGRVAGGVGSAGMSGVVGVPVVGVPVGAGPGERRRSGPLDGPAAVGLEPVVASAQRCEVDGFGRSALVGSV